VGDGLLWVLSRYNRRSVVMLGILLASYVAIGWIWRHMLDTSRTDWLLTGIWLFMTALLCWDIDAQREAIRAGVGFVGGLVIEGWGTLTEIWWYWTDERPPIWILPAWPVAAISIDRLGRAVEHLLPHGRHKVLWWLMLPPFVVGMTLFVWPKADHWATQIAIAGMVLILVWPGDSRQDVALMIGGAALGLFLEYWGTSRRCWTYYTLEVPPVAAVFAHGFASVAFQRAADLIERALAWWQEGRARTA
jgi:hypothetical protein